jgi:hypothetical protein
MKFFVLYALCGLPFALSASTSSTLDNASKAASVISARSTSTTYPTSPTRPILSLSRTLAAASGLASSQICSISTAKITSIRVSSSSRISVSAQGVSSARSSSILRTISTVRTSTVRSSIGGPISPSSKLSSLPTVLTTSTASSPLPADSNPPQIPPQGSGGICGGSPNGCWGNFSIETDAETTWPNTGRMVEVRQSF